MNILELFKIPEKAQFDSRIFIKDIIHNLELDSKNSKILEKSIATVHLKGVLQEDTTNIWEYVDDTYSYLEVDVIYVVLKETNNLSFVNEQLQKVFPNPLILIYELGNKYVISTALKRINKVDSEKSVIEEIQITNLFELESKHIELLSKFSYNFKNLKDFYENMNNIVAADELITLTGIVPNEINNEIKLKSIKVHQLLKEKKELELQYKDADSMQERMTIHMKIKEIDGRINSL